MLNSLYKEPEKLQLTQGSQLINRLNKERDTEHNNIIGLEKGSLQSHETKSQLMQTDVTHSQKTLNYARINNKINLESANSKQGNIFNSFFKSFKNYENVKHNDNAANYQKLNIESMANIEPLKVTDEESVPSDKLLKLQNLEDKFNLILSNYVSTYKMINNDIVERKKTLSNVSQYLGKAVTLEDETGDKDFYYVNDYGQTHKYSADGWIANDKSCPNTLTKISSNELDLLQDSVAMTSGQPCQIAGKNIQRGSNGEVAWVDIRGVKHVYSNIAWKGKQKSCNVKPVVLTPSKYDLIPSGSNMTTTSYCDTQGVDPNIWIQLTNLIKN